MVALWWSSAPTGGLGAVVEVRCHEHRGAAEYSANPSQPRRVHGARSRGESNVSSFGAHIARGGGAVKIHILLRGLNYHIVSYRTVP